MNNEIVGFIDERIMDEAIYYKEKVVILEHVCVKKENRRNNVASKLLKKFKSGLISMGRNIFKYLPFLTINQRWIYIKNLDMIYTLFILVKKFKTILNHIK